MEWLVAFFVFSTGAIIGSFLNVVIHRYPREESIVFPASRCPACAAPIRAFDNIPILSYVILRGQCRACRAAISPRYPLVELANALFYVAIVQRTGLTGPAVVLAAIVSITIALIYIDLEIQILPDVLDLPGLALGLLLGALQIGETSGLLLSESLLDSAAGAALGAAVIVVIRLTYYLIRKAEGMGLGDVKMLAMIGAVVGWEPVFAVLFAASVSGALVGLPLALARAEGLRVALPFGVFLGLAFLFVLFFGRAAFGWYISLLV